MQIIFSLLFYFFPFLLAAQAPNIVFILADDMGWNGTAVQLSPTETGSMSDFYETPNLQLLASQGMTFSQAYAPAAKCAPTRCSILTGETTARNSFTETGNGTINDKVLIQPLTNLSLPETDITIAEWLTTTNMNYRSAHFGKWHLGNVGPEAPAHGFDDSNGSTGNNDGDTGDGEIIQTDPKKMVSMTDSGIAFMQAAVGADEPFYLQLSHYAVHSVIETTQEAFDYYENKPVGTVHHNVPFAGMTQDLDEQIGRIMTALDDLGIADNTYIIFTSDNGSSNAMSSNTPLLRGKAYIYEGGIRVPMIIKGPNIPANSHSAEPVVGYDLFPTISEWTGSNAVLPSTLDGESLVSILLEQGTFQRQKPLIFHIPHYATNPNKVPRSAAVSGVYKLIVEYETGIDYLYDLSQDIGESNDIAASNPTIVNELRIALRDHLKEVNANMPTLDPSHASFSGVEPDVDADGLLDEWEFRELLSFHYGANDDPDGDGDDNLTEMNNGTDPLVDETVLAVNNITEFKVKLLPNQTVQLQWKNLVPVFLKNYQIERSGDGENWETIGTIEADFKQFIDATPHLFDNYYRLKMNYLDGQYNYSNTSFIWRDSDQSIELFPNPSNGHLTLTFKTPIVSFQKIKIVVYDVNGKMMKTINTTKMEQIELSLGDLEKGQYVLEIWEEEAVIGMKQVQIF